MKLLYILFFIALSTIHSFAQHSVEKAVRIEAEVKNDDITLKWDDNISASYHTIYRLADDSTWELKATKYVPELSYTDKDVQKNKAYTYLIYRENIDKAIGYGLITTGIEVEPIHNYGELMLCYESDLYNSLKSTFATYEKTLELEGWKIKRILVNSSNSVKEVKNSISNAYDKKTTKALLLIGNIAVPYSGFINPDGHNTHKGAWPTDLYYVDFSDSWTDENVNSTSSKFENNKNIPFDGKFDLSYISNTINIMVGRIFLDKMPSWDAKDNITDRYKRYFEKNILFRKGNIKPSKRAIVQDNFKSEREGFAANAYRYFTSICSLDSVSDGNYSSVFNKDYLLAYGAGPGQIVNGNFSSCTNVANSSDFLTDTSNVIFNSLFGSYFGDWDNADNLLRAPLCNWNPSLVNIWIGRPNWYLNEFASGMPIGYSFLSTINKRYDIDKQLDNPYNFNSMIHVGVQGDITLKHSYFKAVENVQVHLSSDKSLVNLSWEKPKDETYLSYYIYRLNPNTDSLDLITPQPISKTSFIDSFAHKGLNYYQIKAQVAVNNTNGYFYYLSAGAEVEIDEVTPKKWTTIIDNKINITIYPNPSTYNIVVKGNDVSKISSYSLCNLQGQLLLTKEILANTESHFNISIDNLPQGTYILKLSTADSNYSKRIVKR